MPPVLGRCRPDYSDQPQGQRPRQNCQETYLKDGHRVNAAAQVKFRPYPGRIVVIFPALPRSESPVTRAAWPGIGGHVFCTLLSRSSPTLNSQTGAIAMNNPNISRMISLLF